jgi:spermidine synthase
MHQTQIRSIALLLTTLTGFTGLVYEVTWEKLLATLLGSHSAATAAVLGLFLGGLALGYALFGHLTRRLLKGTAQVRPGRLLIVYGAIEVAIGVHALAFLPLLELTREASLWLPGTGGPGAFALDVALAALVIAPGAVLMGGTIPFLTQALARDVEHATRIHAQVYAVNTLGAFVGALAAGFWLLPSLGLGGVLTTMAALNLAAGAAFAWLGFRSNPSTSVADLEVGASLSTKSGLVCIFAAIAALTGFAMMAVQTVLIRIGALALGASQLTFSMVVAAFVVCIAAGSFGVSALRHISRRLLAIDLWALVAVLTLLYAPLENATWAAHVVRSFFGREPVELFTYLLCMFLVLLLAIGPAVLLSGATLPLVFHQLRREHGDLGSRAGSLYGWNTLGSLAGALLGGFVLLYWLELHQVYRLALVAIAMAAGLATWHGAGARAGYSAAAVAGCIALLAALPPWSPDRMAAGVFRDRTALPRAFDGPGAFFAANPRGRIIFHTDDPTATISVKEGPGRDGRIDRAIVTNGKSDGFVLGERMTTGLLALVPALLAERAERAFVIGFGTGVTAAVLADLDEIREVVVSEISPGVIEAARWFDPANGNASRHPKISIREEDAYRALLRSGRRYDLIVSEPSNPWVAGVEMLYSREFLEAARDRLRPGGVHGQWFHLYDVDTATLGLVLRTYAAVFEHVSIWFTLDADLLLLGMRDAEQALDVERLHARATRPDFARGLASVGIAGFPQLLAHELLPLGVLDALALEGPLHTLVHPRLGHAAARAFFSGNIGELPFSSRARAAAIGSKHSLVRRFAARSGGTLGESARAALVTETCAHRPRRCAALLADWRRHALHSSKRDALHADGVVPAVIDGVATADLIDALLLLHGGGAFTETEDPVSAATTATNLFTRYYHHAAPFDRAALAEYWQRCERRPSFAASCREKRQIAERALGTLSVDLAQRSATTPLF